MKAYIPLTCVLVVIVALWYVATVWLNSQWVYDQAARVDVQVEFREMVAATMNQKRPVLPAPHQVAAEFSKMVFETHVTSPRSLVFHAWVTLSGTLMGFALGTVMGVILAVGIVYNRAMDMSVMPWAIASQMVPIVALAPMLSVVLSQLGLGPPVSKAFVASYLTFFPVVVGMVAGLRSPDPIQLDLLRTYSASPSSAFWKLRLPASVRFLFTSSKVAIAAALVGTIVAELNQPTGLGARLLSGSYNGQTAMIWATLFVAALMAGALVLVIEGIERVTMRRMGMLT